MTIDTTLPEQSVLRHQIETLVIAASRIKGLREPDQDLVDAITADAVELLADRRCANRGDDIGVLVERIAAIL